MTAVHELTPAEAQAQRALVAQSLLSSARERADEREHDARRVCTGYSR